MASDWAGLGAKPDAVALVLVEAAQRLRDAGWTQGRFRDDAGRIDASQALASVVGLDLARDGQRDRRLSAGACVLMGAALDRVLARVGATNLAQWNDDPERTLEQVFGALAEEG